MNKKQGIKKYQKVKRAIERYKQDEIAREQEVQKIEAQLKDYDSKSENDSGCMKRLLGDIFISVVANLIAASILG